MENFFEQFINGIYQRAQQELTFLFGYPPYRCPVIRTVSQATKKTFFLVNSFKKIWPLI